MDRQRIQDILEFSREGQKARASDVEALCEEILRLDQQLVDLTRWRTALVEAAIVDWSISNENMDDPKKMLNDIVVNNMRQALDPAISGDAVKLIQQGREALDAELEPHPCVKCGDPCRCGHRRPCHGCYAHESP